MTGTLDSELMTDQELQKKLGLGKTTFYNLTTKGPSRKRYEKSRDIRLIDHFAIGGKRYWRRESYVKFIRGEI